MISRLTLYEVAGNPDDINITFAGPDEYGKFIGWITRGPGHDYKPLISTQAIFDTAEAAKSAMKEIVQFANNFTEEDLANPDSLLVKFFSTPEGRAVSEIVLLAKK